MIPLMLRRLVAALSVLAFLSGMTIQAVPSAEALGLSATEVGAQTDPECPRMAMEHHNTEVPAPLPCKGIMLDCVKQMGCLGTPALPDRSSTVSVPVAYTIVVYWSPGPSLSGQNIEPDLFPPIAG
jgi:hypothetical protein